jgi:hypothetical protein
MELLAKQTLRANQRATTTTLIEFIALLIAPQILATVIVFFFLRSLNIKLY